MVNSEFKEIEEEQNEIEEDLTEPFDPKDIDISVEQRSLDSIFARIKHNEIDLNTEFHRGGNLWSNVQMSRLIESVMLRFPLPAFYFDASYDNCWLVVDGLQRLCTFKRFVIDCENPKTELPLKLVGLEFLKKYEGITFSELPLHMQRRIKETLITTYFIKPGTPDDVKYSIFYRINTSGNSLSAQEIRHVLNQNGHINEFLKTLSRDQTFKRVVNISSRRMQDQELILLHMAYRLHSFDTYKPPMKRFLNNAMSELNKCTPEELEKWKSELLSALETSEILFGEHAFSKSILYTQQKPVLNRGLFEVLTILLVGMTEEQKKKLISNKEKFVDDFKELLKDANFIKSITSSTTGSASIKERFEKTAQLFERYL